jgi:hypothetical protein
VPKSNPKLPETAGFAAGTFLDGSVAYVGTGVTSTCYNEDLMPARLATVKTITNTGPGAYFECNGPIFANAAASYLKANANLKWVPAAMSNQTSVVGAIKVTGSYYSYWIGRINLTSSTGIVYQQIAKIHVYNGMFWYVREDGTQASANSSYEMLACNS